MLYTFLEDHPQFVCLQIDLLKKGTVKKKGTWQLISVVEAVPKEVIWLFVSNGKLCYLIDSLKYL